MATVEKSIDVNVPVNTAYNQWTQFESFPMFMDAVEEVRQIDDKTLHWRANMGGNVREWDATITEQVPDERIAWTSTDGTPNAGVVTFHFISADTTRVTLQMEYETSGFMESVGDAMGYVSGQIQNDLENFKSFMEDRGTETGAWRGEIEHGQTAGVGSGTSVGSGPTSYDRTGAYGSPVGGSMPSNQTVDSNEYEAVGSSTNDYGSGSGTTPMQPVGMTGTGTGASSVNFEQGIGGQNVEFQPEGETEYGQAQTGTPVGAATGTNRGNPGDTDVGDSDSEDYQP